MSSPMSALQIKTMGKSKIPWRFHRLIKNPTECRGRGNPVRGRVESANSERANGRSTCGPLSPSSNCRHTWPAHSRLTPCVHTSSASPCFFFYLPSPPLPSHHFPSNEQSDTTAPLPIFFPPFSVRSSLLLSIPAAATVASPPYISSVFPLPSPHLQQHEYIIIRTMGPCLLFMNYQPRGQTKPIFIRNLHFISAPIRLGGPKNRTPQASQPLRMAGPFSCIQWGLIASPYKRARGHAFRRKEPPQKWLGDSTVTITNLSRKGHWVLILPSHQFIPRSRLSSPPPPPLPPLDCGH